MAGCSRSRLSPARSSPREQPATIPQGKARIGYDLPSIEFESQKEMTAPVFANVKISGPYAEHMREESARRRVSQAALASEYVLAGIEARNSPDSDKLAGFERRIASTLLSLRGDTESLTATVDMLVATLDGLVKLVLLLFPEPSADALEGVKASAQARHEDFLKMVALTGFDDERPVALRKLVALLSERLGESARSRFPDIPD